MSKIHAAILCALMVGGPAGATTIFSTDFESGQPLAITGDSGIASTTSPVINGSVAIDGQQIWQDYSSSNPGAPTTLTLTGLNAGQDLTLDFTFLAIGSWDGVTYEPGTYAPDYFNVTLNSNSIFEGSFRNYGASGNPEYPGCSSIANSDCTSTNYPAVPAGTSLTLQQSASNDFGTSIYHIIVTGLSANGSGNATFKFFASGIGGSWQGGGDESIGLDNIRVTSADVTGAPEPSTWVMIGGALVCLPLLRRRVFSR